MATPAPAKTGKKISGSADPLTLACPRCDYGIGAVITAPDSDRLIRGARIEPFDVWPDDRGYFLEIARMSEGLAAELDPAEAQVSAALSYPGTIKAFHYHQLQTDYWAAASGVFQVALADLRQDSPTFGLRNTMYVGALRPWRILIPPGVAHGYKVVSLEPGLLIYLTSNKYNPSDEGRIAHDDGEIAYDWELQHK